MTVRKSALVGERLLHLEGTDEDDSAVIRSVMYYPENAKNRASYLQYSRLLVSLAGAPEPFDRPLSLSDDVLAALTRRATIVGALLACYQLLDHFKESTGVFARPSMDKAIHAVRGFAQYAGRFRDDSVIHTSKRTLNKYWSEYRSVAPLWAAMWFNDENSPYAFMSPDAQFNSRRNIELFIGVAKGLRAFGTTRTFMVKRFSTTNRLGNSLHPF